MTVERVETGVRRSIRTERVSPTASSSNLKRLGTVVVLLFLSGLVYCTLVVWQRDAALRKRALERAQPIQAWIEDYLSERSFLPPTLPEKLMTDFGAPMMVYPHRYDIARLRGSAGTFVLIAGPRQGLITPGGDGCAVVIYDNGAIRTAWMSATDVNTARRHRQTLLKK